MTRDEGLATLAGFAPVRWPGADAVLLCGSTVAGTATPNSDLDVLVLFAEMPDGARRETFELDGTLVESFIHDLSTLRYFLETDGSAGSATLANLVAEGVAVPGFPGRSIAAAKAAAAATLAAGPRPLDAAEIDRRRYTISNLAEDIVPGMPAGERIAVAAALHAALVDFALRAAGRFGGEGKGKDRALRRHDQILADLVARGIERLVAGDDAAAIHAAVDAVLSPFGGRLVAGYVAQAPRDWRRP